MNGIQLALNALSSNSHRTKENVKRSAGTQIV